MWPITLSKIHADINTTAQSPSDMNINTIVRRRQVIRGLGVAVTAPLLLSVAGCGGTDSGTDNSVAGDSGIDDDTQSSGTNTTQWASGGTAAMEAVFPPETDPFATGLGNLCQITEAFTIGPCFFDVDDERDDISEGEPGVPMTLAMKLVDNNCQPIENAQIEVWWCNSEGVYSGDDSDSRGDVSNFNTGFCTGNESDALSARWFRGIKTTDSVGNVYFKACFPGWYRGRTTHIHFRIVVDGTQQLVSQFCFDDDLCNDIYENHSDYTGQEKDTSNSSDNVFNSNYQDYIFEVEEQWDRSMLAYKAIQVDIN